MTLKSKPLATLVVGILFGGILLSSWLGWWKTESSKIAATFIEGEFAGQANPADIRGSYTFGDVEKNFGVSSAVLAQAFNVTTTPAEFQVKSLEGTATQSGVEIGTASVRLFVAFYKNLPIDLTTDTFIPEQAVALLKEHGLTTEQSAYLETHTAILASSAGTVPVVESTPETVTNPQPETTDRLVKGKTTFGELMSWGLSHTSIETILGMPVDASSTALKDFCSANNLNFETIKPALQAEVDKLK